MVKNILLFFICVFSLAAGSPCYSGCCSSRPVKKDGTEAEKLLAATVRRSSPSSQKRTSSSRVSPPRPKSVVVNEGRDERQILSSSSGSRVTSTSIVPFGHMQLVVPGNVEITDDGHGNKLISLPDVCCLIVFDEYRQAIVDNKIVKALHDSKRNQISQCTDLDKKIGTSYNDMRTTAQQVGGSAEAFIHTMEGFVEEITRGTDGTTIPDGITVKWERHKTTFEGRILFVKDSRALLVRINPAQAK